MAPIVAAIVKQAVQAAVAAAIPMIVDAAIDKITEKKEDVDVDKLQQDLSSDNFDYSDERLKQISPREYIKKLILSGKKLTKNDALIAIRAFKKKGSKENVRYAPYWKDKVLDGYVQNIHNYVYHYKPMAEKLDPSIDSDTEHIGPMAQEIEKVNPAAVTEKGGYKAVDTGRLALMNAGAIASLARKIEEMDRG